MADGVVDLGDGVTLTPSTEADFAYVNANLREGDRAERDVFGEDEKVSNFERVWTVRSDGEIVGTIGYLGLGESPNPLDRRRFIAGLTTNVAWSIRRKFVKNTPRVFNAVLNRMPSWVDTVYNLPLRSYRGACIWIERVAGFTKVCELEMMGKTHVLYVRRKRGSE